MCGNEKENGTGGRSKRQREDIRATFPLHSREQQINSSSSQHEKSNNMPGQQVDPAATFSGGNNSSNSLNSGSQVGRTNSPGLGAFTTDGSFPSSEFKQENQVTVSCEGPSSGGQSSASLLNGAGQPGQSTAKFGTYLEQQLSDFERVFEGYKKAAEEKRTSDVLANVTSQGQEVSGKQRPNLVTSQEVEQNQRLQVTSLPIQLASQQAGPPRLQEFAHESSLSSTPSRTQSVPFIVGEGHGQTHTQYRSEHVHLMEERQEIVQKTSFQPSPYSTGAKFCTVSQLPSEQLQEYQVLNQTAMHNQNDPILYQRTLQTHSSQQSLYSFRQQQNMSPKLSHPPLEEQLRSSYPQFQNPQVVPSSQARASAPQVGPMSTQDMPRLSGPMYPSPTQQQQQQQHYQRQQSVPSLPRQSFTSTEPLQQQMQVFQTSDQHRFSHTQQGIPTSYHYQRRNSFPIYQRSNMQPLSSFVQGSQAAHSGQINPLASPLQIPGSKYGPTIPVSVSSRIQTGLHHGGRPNTELPSSSHAASSGFFKGQRLDPAASAQQASHAGRKVGNDAVYPYHNINPSIAARPTSAARYPSFSPLGSLIKTPSFTSLLEQSAVHPGNLETTYTGSIPNLDLLGEILGP